MYDERCKPTFFFFISNMQAFWKMRKQMLISRLYQDSSALCCSRQMYGFCLHKQMDHFFQMVFLSHVIIISSSVRYFTISYESVQGFYLTSLFTMDHFGPKERKNVCNFIFFLFLDLAFLLKILIYFSLYLLRIIYGELL